MEQTQALVVIENQVPLADSRVIAKNLGITSRSMMQLIRDHQPEIEKHFGLMRFENAEIKGKGRPEKYALLTEPQTYYILRLGDNTPQSLEVNAQFIKAFMELKVGIIPILQAENAQLRLQLQQPQQPVLQLPEHASSKQAVEILNTLETLVKTHEIGTELPTHRRSNLDFCLRKAQMLFKGGRLDIIDLNEKADDYGNVPIREYPKDIDD